MHPVVAPDPVGQPVLLKWLGEAGLARLQQRAAHAPAAQDVAAVVVRRRQRVVVHPFAGLELTLEIRAPAVVGAHHRHARPPGVAYRPAPGLAHDQPAPLEHVAHGGLVWQFQLWMRLTNLVQQLARSPRLVQRPHLHQRSLDLGRRLVVQLVRLEAALQRPVRSSGHVPTDPFVRALAVDPVQCTQVHDAVRALEPVFNELNSQFHGVSLFPGHKAPSVWRSIFPLSVTHPPREICHLSASVAPLAVQRATASSPA